MKKVIIAFFIWRIATFLVASVSPWFLPFGATFPYYQERLISTHLPHLLWSFGNFDGVHYLGIAKEGYAAQFTQAFFPLYPLLVKILSFANLGNLLRENLSLLVSAFIISNTCFLFGLLLFYKLLKLYYSEKISFNSVLFLLSFPTSFYFGSIYTESLFFLLTISTFYLLEKNKIFLAAMTGFLATSTRLIGIFLALAFLKKGQSLKNLLLAAMVPLGLILYMIYLQFKFNNAFYFLTSQSAFGQYRNTQKIILLPQVIFRYLKILATTHGLVFTSALFDLICTILALSLLIYAIKKVKSTWITFSFASILIPTLTGTLASMPRYVLLAFPIFIVLAQLKSTKVKLLIMTAFVLCGIVALSFFSQGYWVA